MEIEQLRQFMAIVQTENFTRAADIIGLSQPALSRSIARLEEELGQPLFERKARSLDLTEAGKLLQAKARQIIALVDDAKAEISDDGESGQIRVGAIPTIAPFFLPERLRKFQSRHPQSKVIVIEDTTEQLLRKIADGEVDIAIAALPLDRKYLQTEELFEEELLLVMAAENPLTEKKQIKVSDLTTLPFVLLGEAHCLTGSVVSFCHQKSFYPVSVERTSQLAMVQELVSLDHGVSLIPAMAAVRDHSKTRVYRSLAGTKPTRTIALVWNPYRFQSKLQTNFIDWIRASAKQ